MSAATISHVSDTARWIAAYRANESRRPDALFRDPLAERLAGAQDFAIVNRAPCFARSGAFVVARTKLIDDMVAQAVASGFDTIINLAAGLDTRPYRLPLPPSLLWIEADLPAITEEKERLLSDATPVCQLRREKVDLADRAALAAFLDSVTASAKSVMVIAEGLLMYLEPAHVETLSRELLARPAIKSWIINITSPASIRAVNRAFFQGAVSMRFAPANGVAFFEALGWRTAEVASLLQSAARFKRLPLVFRLIVSRLPESNPRNPKGKWGAVIRLQRPI